MRIDYLADAYTGPAAGTEKQLLLLIRGMVERGHDVRLFVLRHTPYTRSVDDFPCPIESLEVGSMASVEALRRMMRFRSKVRRDRTDVVHAYFSDVAILAPLFLKTEFDRVFTSRRDMGFWYDRKVLAALRLANRRVDGIICNSRAVADQVGKREGAPAERLSIICSSLAERAILEAHERLYGDGSPVKMDPPPLRTPIRYGTVTPEDRVVVIDMLGNAAFKGLIWDWQFTAMAGEIQPVGAYDGDRLIGFNGLIGVDVQFDGKRMPAAWSCDFIVAPEYRRHGVGRGLKEELDKRCDLIMALGVSSSAAPVLKRAGWQSGPGPLTWVRWCRPRGLNAMVRKWMQYPTGALARFALPSFSLQGMELTEQAALPSTTELDQLWSICAPGYSRCAIRDGAFLEWRYARFPFTVYRYLVLRRNDQLVAIAVFRASGGIVRFIDYVGPAVNLGIKATLVRALLKASPDATALECTTSDRELQRALLSMGFLPTRFEGHRFFTRLPAAGVPAKESQNWFLMAGDSDGDFLNAARDACWTIREWSEEDFASGRDSWEALLAQSEADRLFMGWEWQHGWWKHFAARLGLRLRIIALYDYKGELAALAPFYVSRATLPSGLHVTRLEPIGNSWRNISAMRSEYISIIVRSDVSDEAPRQLFLHLRDNTSWDELVVRDWNSKPPGDNALREIIGARCMVAELTEPLLDETRFISLEHGFDHYVAQLSGNARRALLNQRKHLESLGVVRMEYADAAEVVEYFHDLNRLHAMRWGAHVFTGARLAFHIELATRLAEHGRLRFSRLSIDNEVVSVLYHMRGGEREYNVQMGFNDKFHANRISLGLLHLGYAVEQAASEGIQAVDLLAGGGKKGLFKQRVAPESQQLVSRRYARSPLSRTSVALTATLSAMARALDYRSRE
jgi:GNAT superfamily N-acetyltransferase